ncbi:DEAD/DEAH box helicase [uncultured Paludibaculum sp.]|uniref:DEAD/DEAH box helicase n=1 Tax=uncultured Paludibaculum sp. TaxID=1765020 RepID=UPI002AAB7188|nr:DEAD/DEAH box helicase [uncultured Paludibaculum sp.]
MTISSKLAFQFDRRVQFRGQDLFASGSVTVRQASPRHLIADVQGSKTYHVTLRYVPERLYVECTCPYFLDEGPCKHVWAAVMAADDRGALAEAADARSLQLRDDPQQPARGSQSAFEPPPPQLPLWSEQLGAIERQFQGRQVESPELPADFEIQYVVESVSSQTAGAVVVDVYFRSRKKNGEWTTLKDFRINPEQVAALPDPVDVEVLASLLGAQDTYVMYGNVFGSQRRRALPAALAQRLVPMMARSGRLMVRSSSAAGDLAPAEWDDGPPWQLWLDIRQDDHDQWGIEGSLRRDSERMGLDEPTLVTTAGFLFARGRVARIEQPESHPWIVQLRDFKRIPFPDRERDTVMERLLSSAVLPHMELDEALRFEERSGAPRIGLRISQKREMWGEEYFQSRLIFDYGFGWKEESAGGRGFWLSEERVFFLRDQGTEDEARGMLRSLGLRPPSDGRGSWRLATKAMPKVVRELVQAAWHVEAEGKAFRRAGEVRVDVRSGIDWFELHGSVDYGDTSVQLPALLAALRRGDGMVQLGDGTFGLLPEKWLQQFGPLAGLGQKQDDHLRFRLNQAALLDALLAAQPAVEFDQQFRNIRERMNSFHGVSSLEQPAGFVGQLRDYQKAGLGWMAFLRDFGFGGCLADDMGVGKTPQVLAALEGRRAEGYGPSLVVAPRSVIFNWRQEAERFTPQLRVLEYSGLSRDTAEIAGHDLILTTYGTVLRDAPRLSEVEFDYVVLDEAQAIKNASTASAKAARLLKGRHRLALSGTPIENHLGELWSLFEFLNPGMLGEAKVLQMAGGLARNPSDEARRLLSQALRPFILRRTKKQVAQELPDKTEQTVYCELEPAQRKQYEELRAHYRESLLQRVAARGLGRSKMHVLEALLRLRQAACHPGLLDPRRSHEPSAKIDLLLEQLLELREEGHKALVFSQFTSLLAIVRARLDKLGIRYEYLDGATRDRQAPVETFQNDESCGLFLISLKAGGLGLNLTAAEYVFLLDPWWNPAVEAQAVDRAHRIGQTRQVFAYRLIAKGTVEEKVLELQKNKRDLADAILSEDNNLLKNLTREDLELLLS